MEELYAMARVPDSFKKVINQLQKKFLKVVNLAKYEKEQIAVNKYFDKIRPRER